MNRFANSHPSVRAEVFESTAPRLGDEVQFSVPEKDFWVCWMLKILFSLGADHPRFVFKGGTSLSKAYELIRRFSEDIDLVTPMPFFLERGCSDPTEKTSTSEKTRRFARLDKECADYIRDELSPTLTRLVGEQITTGEGWALTLDPEDRLGHTLLFRFPSSDPSRQASYLRRSVKIEMGWRATERPTDRLMICSYVAQQYPSAFDDPQVQCDVLTADVTFWEKVTALHAFRFQGKTGTENASRHYADVEAMLGTDRGRGASTKLELLEEVRKFKDFYYHAPAARYDLAKPGTLSLLPKTAEELDALRADYRNMRVMFFGEPIPFEAIVEHLRAFEGRVNGL
jgi:hypothetical protein